MFDRKESIKQAINEKSLDINTLQLMIDFYVMKGKLTEEEQIELMELLFPVIEEVIIEEEIV